MTKYILNDKKAFEIFLRTEKVLKEGKFPIMTDFEEEEIEFFLNNLNKRLGNDKKVLEMGCGSGRILKSLLRSGFKSTGFDNNPYFVDYCKNQHLEVFLFDATGEVSKEQSHRYDVVLIALNTLFNFSENVRKKWIDCACEFLVPKGFLMFTVYNDSEFSRSTVEERIKMYAYVIQPPEDHLIEFFDKCVKRGFQLTNPEGQRLWSSLWVKKEELMREISSWKEFQIIEVSPMECGVAFNVLLQKKE